MRTYTRLIFLVLLILSMPRFVAATEQSNPNARMKMAQKYKTEKSLRENIISWLSDGDDSAGAECDKLADLLLTLEEPGVYSYFIAAQVANLREKPKKAISVLEEVIKKYPDEKAPIGMHVPVKVVGRFWIATIAKQSGDIAKAKNVYETLLPILESQENIEGIKDKGGLMMICNFYLAEIESLHLKRNDLALVRLDAVQQIRKPSEQMGAGFDIYKGWAAYQHTKLLEGKNQAARRMTGYSEMTSAPLLAATQLLLSGIAGEPLASSGKGMTIVTETLCDRAIKTDASPSDRDLVMLASGFDQQYKKNFTKAEKHYSALFQEDSYFSPVAGIYLSRCKRAQGRDSEADGILKEVTTKYPGFDSLVTKIKKDGNRVPQK